ncbi:MAG TPA: hypothetical protein VFO69_08955, partial [Allosphingosinicella sp.]|nr:hypothetical protein [Allosphingosinicella sp.]
KPLSAFYKRWGAAERDGVQASALETLRLGILDVWNRQGSTTEAPDWLGSAELFRTHLAGILGDVFEFGTDDQEPLIPPSLLAFEAPPAKAFARGDMMEAILALADSPPPHSPFPPITLDIPFTAG